MLKIVYPFVVRWMSTNLFSSPALPLPMGKARQSTIASGFPLLPVTYAVAPQGLQKTTVYMSVWNPV